MILKSGLHNTGRFCSLTIRVLFIAILSYTAGPQADRKFYRSRITPGKYISAIQSASSGGFVTNQETKIQGDIESTIFYDRLPVFRHYFPHFPEKEKKKNENKHFVTKRKTKKET